MKTRLEQAIEHAESEIERYKFSIDCQEDSNSEYCKRLYDDLDDKRRELKQLKQKVQNERT